MGSQLKNVQYFFSFVLKNTNLVALETTGNSFDNPNITFTATNDSVTLNDEGIEIFNSTCRSDWSYQLVNTVPAGGFSPGSVAGNAPMTVKGLLPGRVYSMSVMGNWSSSTCGTANGAEENLISNLCTG